MTTILKLILITVWGVGFETYMYLIKSLLLRYDKLLWFFMYSKDIHALITI